MKAACKIMLENWLTTYYIITALKTPMKNLYLHLIPERPSQFLLVLKAVRINCLIFIWICVLLSMIPKA